jgi:hypothetical protein
LPKRLPTMMLLLGYRRMLTMKPTREVMQMLKPKPRRMRRMMQSQMPDLSQRNLMRWS